jgi:type I restriction enzyme S subunit
MNVLGRLLMELREEFKSDRRDALLKVDPLAISDFLLMEQPIPAIEALAQDSKRLALGVSAAGVEQTSLFDQPALIDAEVSVAPMRKVNESMPHAYSNSNSAIADLKPYPEYKDSGLPWLGKIPARWGLAPNRALMHRRKVLVGERHANYKLLSLTKAGVIIRDVASGKGKFSSDMGTSQEVRKGDLVFCLFDVPETPRTVGLSSYDGMITGAYTIFECSDLLLSRFLDCYYRAMDDRKLLSPLYSGLRNTIPPTRFLGTKTAIPPVEEQAAIVRFLDHATRRLDKAIRDKRKIIALLSEQKQAIIHRAVTRGLDPDVPLKDSGIPWLGQIPAHWEARRIKQTTRILRGKFTHRPRNDASLYDGPYPFIQTGAVARAKKFIINYKQTLNEKGLSVSKMFPAGTLVMTIAANIGDVAILNFDACFPDSIVGFVPAEKIDRDYLYLVFLCMKPELLREAPVNTQGNLNVERIGSMGIPLPSLEQQTEIVRYVDSETSSLGSVTSRIEREIELLREYRTRLIADVVTGKLDVREAAARLPELEATAIEPDIAETEEFETELLEES